MRREDLYIADMISACHAIARFTGGLDEASFMGSELHQSAVLQKLTVIGEAATRLSKDFCERHPEIE